LAGLSDDRREALEVLRGVINENIDCGFEEGMQYGMPAWFVPHSVYAAGYHCDGKQPVPFVSIASQKNYMSMYLFCVYCVEGEVEKFTEEWKKTGKKLDMGKSCVRFRKIEDVPVEVVGRCIKRMTMKKFLKHYEGVAGKTTKKKVSKKKVMKKKVTKKKTSKKKTVKKK